MPKRRESPIYAALFTIVVVVLFTGPLHAQIAVYQQGMEAYADGDYEAAAELWLVESYEGSLEAQYNLAVLYIEGKGVAKNREQAIFWFTRAAEGGHAGAQYNLGHLYVENRENLNSVSLGVRWWAEASKLGLPIAQFNFARALFLGIGVEKDIALSRIWMERSAVNGEQAAARFLQKHAAVYGLAATPTRSVERSQPALTADSTDTPDSSRSADQATAQPAEPTHSLSAQKLASGSASGNAEMSTQGSGTLTTVSQRPNIVLIPEFRAQVDSGVAQRQPVVVQEETQLNEVPAGKTAGDVTHGSEFPGPGTIFYVRVNTAEAPVLAVLNTPDQVLDVIRQGDILRVVSRVLDWIEVQVPGGYPVWVGKHSTTLKKSFVVAEKDKNLFRDPSEQSSGRQLGVLRAGEALQVISETPGWYQVRSPEQLGGWIHLAHVRLLRDDGTSIAARWQAQRIRALSKLTVREEALIDDEEPSQNEGSLATEFPGLNEADFVSALDATEEPINTSTRSGADSGGVTQPAAPQVLQQFTVDELVESMRSGSDPGEGQGTD